MQFFRSTKRKFFFVLLSLALCFTSLAQKTWVGAGAGGAGTDFNTGTNWSPTGVPIASDNVIIAITSDATITLSANAAVNNLTYTVNGNGDNAILSVGAFTLTVNGNSVIDILSGNGSTDIQIGVNGGTSAGVIDFVGTVSIGPTNDGNGAGFNGNVNSKLIFRNNVTFGVKAFVNITNRPGTIELNGTGTQSLTWNNTDFYCEWNNVVVGNTNNPTINQISGTVTPDNILGNLTVNGSSVLNLGTSQWNGGTAGGGTGNAGTLTLASTAKLQLGAVSGGQTGSNFPLRFSALSIASGSTIEYTGTSAQTVYDIASPGYGHLTTTNNSVKTAGNALDIRGNLLINSTSTFAGSTFSHTLGGNWTNNGTYTPATSTVTLNGTVAQAIGGSTSTTFSNLTVNKSAGAVTLNIATRINGAGTFTAGVVNSTSTNLLTFSDNATTAGANNGSTPSYVNGPVRKEGNDDFIFPVGKTGAGYRYCAISSMDNTSDIITAEFMRASASALGTITAAGLNHVSNCEYWDIDEDGPLSPTINITLSWNGLSNCNAAVYVNDLATLTIAHFGTTWDSHGSSSYTGNVSAGDITRNGVSVFSPFTLGSTSALTNPLPVKLVNVKAYPAGDNNKIEWANLTEAEVESYEVERSIDGVSFTAMSIVEARGNAGTREDYNQLDNSTGFPTIWYRIKAKELGGAISYSPIVKVSRGDKDDTKLILYPNPVVAKQVTVQLYSSRAENYTIRIFNNMGQLVHTTNWQHAGGSSSRTIELPANIVAGVYYLKLSGRTKDLNSRITVQ